MKLKVSTSKEALEPQGSSYISASGVYDVTIKFASVDVAASSAESVNFNLDYNGNDQTIYGPYITSKAGETIEIGARLINNLAVIAGMSDGDDYEVESEEHSVGKDKKVQNFDVITNFSGIPVKIQLQEEYGINPKNSEIRKRMVIKNFFTEDGASAKEFTAKADEGKQLATVLEKYASNITYKDDLTPELVAEWKASKSSNKPAAKPQAKVANKPASTLFAN